jgi:hypothetical protein
VGSDGSSSRLLTAEDLARQRALRAAVLIDAVRCVVGVAVHRDRRSRQSAVRWILSRDTRSPFSFYNVCESLGFEPVRIRRLLVGPALGLDTDVRLKLEAATSGALVRRPRRDQPRYVVLQGGRRA